jgi:acetyl esterase/lipase
MLSLRCRLLLFLLHHRHILRFSRKETARDWLENIAAVRQKAEKAARRLGPPSKRVTVSPVEPFAVGAPPAVWIRPKDLANDDGAPVLFYFHGGGYVLGSIEAHLGIVAKFALGASAPALLFGYRLAPEHPYPAALDDARVAYRQLAQEVDPRRIVFVGDSAGGGLCLATLLALRDEGAPLPAAAVALSPWTDMTCSGESLVSNAKTCLSPTGAWLACREHYAVGRDFTDPYLSPLFGDLRGLPPLFISAGGAETLLSDAERFANKARVAGVLTTLRVGPGLFHCYPACAPLFPEATRALREICAFIQGSVRKERKRPEPVST